MMPDQSMYTWRTVIISHGDIPAISQHIALYLATFMNEWGDNCFPSIARITADTKLSKPTVIKHIKILRESGWLTSIKVGYEGQGWAHNQYYPAIPENVVNEINRVAKGGKPQSIRRLTSEHKAVNQVDTNYPITNQRTNQSIMSGKPDPAPKNGKKSKTKELKASAEHLLEFLNRKTGKHFRPVKSNLEPIMARLKEFPEDEIQIVIANRCMQWRGDEKMAPYLRPLTLFRASNFANYHGEINWSES